MDTVSFRLPDELIEAIGRAAARRGVERSIVVREAIASYLASGTAPGRRSTGELVDALVTYPGSGVGDLAARSEQHLRAKLHGRRRPR